MSTTVYGLDFGTTNTAVAITRNGSAEVLPIGAGGTATIPSLAFFPEYGRGYQIGQNAIDGYLGSEMNGRLLQSVKSFLPDPGFKGTAVGGQLGYASIEKLIGILIKFVKQQADAHMGEEVTDVIIGRPALFSDDPERDALAEKRLVDAARYAGFEHIQVQKEPIAAAFEYERSLDREEIAFIADFGGGTSDFTIMRLGPEHVTRPDRADDILGVDGVYVGGNNFDSSIMWRRLIRYFGSESESKDWDRWLPMPRHLMQDLCRWQRITFLKDRKTREYMKKLLKTSNDPESIKRLIALIEENLGFSVFQAIEKAKHDLSQHETTSVIFNESVIEIEERISRQEFEEMSCEHIQKIEICIDELLTTSQIALEQVDTVFVTGGTSYIPAVRRVLSDRFGDGKIRTGDAFISVAAGLALGGSTGAGSLA
ncbi:MAG: Hsp70 family protein [Candidatus Latescibacteria bacterium]|nr:Hsp70 family protein [Candidatus Latescibacterota bacterium]